MNLTMTDRVAVITGGSKGIGLACARRFAESGARVAIVARGAEGLASARAALAKDGLDVRDYVCDVSRAADISKTYEKIVADFGKIDILVNNAGIAGINKTVWETDLEEWRKVLRINLDGPFICCKAIAPVMIGQGYGRIVNIASIAGKEGNPNAAHYSASKAGLIALTKSLGKELAQHDILVNAVTPAAARTAIFDQMTQQHIDFMLSKIPKGRFVLVEELAAMVAWLASEDCAFSTGAVFDISGGRATY